jgi:hypothetical protein
MLGGQCQQCPIRLSCLPEKHRHRARFVYRSPHQDEIDRIKKRQVTPHFKRKLAERQWKAEGAFGEVKGRHGLQRAKYRSHAKMQIQLYLTAITQNLKRLIGDLCDFLTLLWDSILRLLYLQKSFTVTVTSSDLTEQRFFNSSWTWSDKLLG